MFDEMTALRGAYDADALITGQPVINQYSQYIRDRLVRNDVKGDCVLRLKGSGNLDAIQIIKKLGGNLADSYLETGFLLDKFNR